MSEENHDDPAADFLAKEQEELGDLGQELGLKSNSPSMLTASLEDAQCTDVGDLNLEESAPREFSVPKVEPETIRIWREEQTKRLLEKDAKEEKKMSELKEQAKRELQDWYKHYNEQLDKTKATNRENEKEFVAEVNNIVPGTEWERVSKLVDFNTKSIKHSKDMSRMRSIMLQLKQQNPPINAS